MRRRHHVTHIHVVDQTLEDWLHDRHTSDAKEVHGATIAELHKMRPRGGRRRSDPLHRPPVVPAPVRKLSQVEIHALYSTKEKGDSMTMEPVESKRAKRERQVLELLSKQTVNIHLSDFVRLFNQQIEDRLPMSSALGLVRRLQQEGKLGLLNDNGRKYDAGNPGNWGCVLVSPSVTPASPATPPPEAEVPDEEPAKTKSPLEVLAEAAAMIAEALKGLKLDVNIKVEFSVKK